MPQRGVNLLTLPQCGVNLPHSGRNRRSSNPITRRHPMANEPLRRQVKKQLDEVTETAHQVFLAGLGAAALSQEETGRLFDRLVNRGRKVEAEGRKKVAQ